MTKEQDLELVKKYQKELRLISNILALLAWDLETYMPKSAANARAEQTAFLEKFYHEKINSKELFESLEKLRKENLFGEDKIIIEKFYKDVVRAKKIPKELVEELARITPLSFSAWQEAREKNDFKIFQPYLEKIVELKRKQASYIGLPGHIYNNLLDDFEEGMTVEILTLKFRKLKEDLVKLLNEIKNSKKYRNQKLNFKGWVFPREKQMDLARDVVERMGLKNEFSRIDFAEHPFEVKVGRGDVRITTNIREDPMFSFLSSVHEAGHGLYESNFPEEYSFNVLGNAPSFGLHESQSRFWENMIAKGVPFWKYYFHKFKKEFGVNDFEKWYEDINFVNPSKIRIESDEVHYALHIILRFEIELGLLEGTISVKDLPKIWNQKMKELFGIIPENDKEGVLQDVHWSQGYFGYFPTYILGSIYAAQIYESLKREFPQIDREIEKGDFSRISEWLKEKIHKHGKKLLAEEIIKNACGEGLNPDCYIDYLRDKYLKIYN